MTGNRVIIGNGGAAVHAVMALRASGYKGPVRLVSDVDGPAFNPMLSPYYLGGQIPLKRCFPFGRDFYRKHDVACRFGSPAEALDPVNRIVFLANGKRLPYEQCLIATGARPTLPKGTGLDQTPHVYTFRSREDAERLRERLGSARDAVILGASLVGIKLAEILMKRGMRVTLVDVAEQVLPRSAHPRCADLLGGRIVASGVDLRLGRRLQGAEHKKGRVLLSFEDNESIGTDLCLVCTGVEPNLELVRNSRVESDRGILTDDRMRTSAEGLYAAGDVSQAMNRLSGKKEWSGRWESACYQGRTAGSNMAGMVNRYPGALPEHISTVFGLTFVHLGRSEPEGKEVRVVFQEPAPGAARLLLFEGGVLVGANLINCFRDAGRLKSAIIRKRDWGGHLEKLPEDPKGKKLDQILAALGA
jgi:NADPH-dependent 2,4-dienoyl-CoA reductase/sulfur reductase-like enzyme